MTDGGCRLLAQVKTLSCFLLFLPLSVPRQSESGFRSLLLLDMCTLASVYDREFAAAPSTVSENVPPSPLTHVEPEPVPSDLGEIVMV